MERFFKNISKEQFYPYISYIRFPYYKKLKKNLRIDFNYPITAIIGSNGSSKTSILRALYGSPERKSLGVYWFESKLDSIDKGEQVQKTNSSFIYGYYNLEAKRDVEIRKMRTNSKNKNPDYWEATKPSLKDDMEEMPQAKEKLVGRSETRWNAIEKNVVYIDFRHETLSAYDKYFYTGKFNVEDLQKKKDFIRYRSRYLHNVINGNMTKYPWHRIERISYNKFLSNEQVSKISQILDKQYSRIRIIDHSFYTDNTERSIYMTNDEINYSEAFAGSGEFAIVSLVKMVMEANERSLIILDEPEVSLHVRAQRNLMNFLQEEVLKKKHQVVFATHSPFLVEDLPKEAIHLLYEDNKHNEINIKSNILSEQAFSYTGVNIDKKKIIVEDELAKRIVKDILYKKGVSELVDVFSSPNGESTIKTISILDSAVISCDENTLYLLDGDQKKVSEHKDPNEIPESDNCRLSEIIKTQTGCAIKIPHPNGREDIKIKNQRLYLAFYKKYVHYFPVKIPEDMIWAVVPDDEKLGIGSSDAKKNFAELTKEIFGDMNSSSEYVLKTQEMFFKYLDIERNTNCIEIWKKIEPFIK